MKSKRMYPVAGLALIMILAVGDYSSSAKTPDGPETVLTETAYDFGVVHEGEEVRHPFVVKNTGKLPLTIVDVKTD